MVFRAFMMIFLFIAAPLSWGILYVVIMKDEHKSVCSIWLKGTAIMLAIFSFAYNAVTRGAKQERMLLWKPKYWLIISVVVSVVSCGILIYRLFRHVKTRVCLAERHIINAVIVAFVLFAGALILIKPYDKGIADGYIHLYNGEVNSEVHPELTGEVLTDIREEILTDPIVSFYLTENELIKMGADKFLMIMVPGVLLLLSVGCYDFLADMLCIPKEKKSLFVVLIYVLLTVTYMSRDYHLFGIYTNFWEPLTVFVSLFLPFQFGMMIYVMDVVYRRDMGILWNCLFWILTAAGLGYLFRYMDPLIVLAPEAAGAVAGYLRARSGQKETTC